MTPDDPMWNEFRALWLELPVGKNQVNWQADTASFSSNDGSSQTVSTPSLFPWKTGGIMRRE
jgi:hypothetical protein